MNTKIIKSCSGITAEIDIQTLISDTKINQKSLLYLHEIDFKILNRSVSWHQFT